MLPSSIPCEILSTERNGLGLVRLTVDLVVETSIGTITVPAGYVTDFASIPRIGRPFFCSMGKSALGSIVHDYLLHKNDTRANRVFLELLKAWNVSLVGRYLMFAFVWAFTEPTFLIDELDDNNETK